MVKTNDDTRDLAIQITDELVKKGYVPNCIDTDSEIEFEVQDIIHERINKALNIDED